MTSLHALSRDACHGVWSAVPTPFTPSWDVDRVAVRRMVAHHLRLGVRGLFLAGTNGEGPFLTDRQRRDLVTAVVRAARGRLPVAVQVTDNSAPRVLDRIAEARALGADLAVIAQPYFFSNATPSTLRDFYRTVIRASPLPIGFYDRGRHSAVAVPEALLPELYAEPNLAIVKDSSSDPARMRIALAARRRRPALRLFNGDEFHAVPYLQAGYDGLLLGGGVFNGKMANQIIAAVARGDLAAAAAWQRRMNRLMWAVYGGRRIACWLAGEKHLLVRLGIFRTWRNYPRYPLTPACRRAIARALRAERAVLLP